MSSELKTCRICLAEKDTKDLISIFNGNCSIASEIFNISGIELIEFVSTTSQIPALICSICTKELSTATKFKEKCLKSDEFFKKLLKEIETSKWTNELKLMKNDKEACKIKEEPDDFSDHDFPDFPDSPPEELFEPKVLIKQEKVPTKKPAALKKVKDNNCRFCRFCSESFETKSDYKLHFKLFHGKSTDASGCKCHHCGKSFTLKRNLTRHIKVLHAGPNPVVCKTEEDKLFDQKPSLYKCTHCEKYFKNLKYLKDHIKVKHEYTDYSERFICDICGKDIIFKYQLRKHIRQHFHKYKGNRKVEQLPCSICAKIFKNISHLKIHEKSHQVLTPEEYFYCDICGNKFKFRGLMVWHMNRKHLNPQRFYCDQCPGRSYGKMFYLRQHIKVFHNNIRDFKCEWCGKEFGDKPKLKNHMRTHTGEKPYQCTWPGCDRKYAYNTDLRRHIWGHTGERPHKCDFPGCSNGYMKISELNAHKQRSHSLIQYY